MTEHVVPEEIFKVCYICKREFNFEWGGFRVQKGVYVCSNEKCQKTHKTTPENKKPS
jgi:hypothetical protein